MSVSACVCDQVCVMYEMEVCKCGCVMNVKDVGVHGCGKDLESSRDTKLHLLTHYGQNPNLFTSELASSNSSKHSSLLRDG